MHLFDFIVSGEGIQMDKRKVKSIQHWPIPTTVSEIRSFYGLANFYKRFLRHFNTIMSPLTECMKVGGFHWSQAHIESFKAIKEALISTPILALPDFNKLFQVGVDAFDIGIGAVLEQESNSIEFFQQKT